ncbi:heterokaryon incompatibility protein-domain-containing protein [Lasiosphaeria hispida]|uniref:Heterokaryon incompatibility protein-domain-containing protein n=1 Tax=Lasiosphaeria hispida TaxID=260671 RepID=A0AAJ0HMU7_9PEZI|nr:heterokaryon incompatibility protein-domain-containing protein [Lasiosphaeria hispida]
MEDSSSDSPWVGAIRPRQAKAALVGSHVDWSLGLHWLEDCRENHEECTREKTGSLPAGFRLIDVNRRCVVETQANCQFVALSYVWGRHPDLTKLFATRSNRERLKIDGSLSVLDLPKTVEDAIEACRQLGEGYLWIDRFCILQDDLEDKGHQINAMAAIYSLAKFALIITDGDSDSGIAGISRERTQTQMREQISGFAFISEPADWREIIGGESVWSTRGWTYQEAVLPHRKLYLSESQAFFECATHVADECGAVQQAMYSPHGLNKQPWHHLYDTFYSHLARYRARSLTNPDDVYNAIDGVASALYGGFHSLLSGLPRQEFDEALLWCLDGHTDSTLQGAASNGSSPSWSWSSTDRQIALLNDTNRRSIDYCDTLTAWSRVSQDGKSLESVRTMPRGKPLSHFRENQDSCGCCRDKFDAKKDAERLLFPVLAWSQGCINRPSPFAQPHETTFAATRAGIRARWSCRHQYWLEALQDVANSPTETNIPPSPSPSTPGASIVFASVQSALFRLQGSVQRNKTSGRIFDDLCIAHPDGQPAGLLIAGDSGLGLGPEITAKSTFEFIALSVGTSKSIVLPDGRLTFRDGAGKLLHPLPVVNVMMVERTGEKSVRRISVGWIYLTSWIRAEPKFRTVFLE